MMVAVLIPFWHFKNNSEEVGRMINLQIGGKSVVDEETLHGFSETTVNKGTLKVRGRPFQKGLSGNPKGKPKGTRNAATLTAESLFDGESEALTRKAIEMALGGDMTAMRLVMDRILPPRRERPLHFELPPLTSAADAINAISEIAGGVAQGELSESEARTLIALVDTFVVCLAQVETDRRLTNLEGLIPKIEAEIAEKVLFDRGGADRFSYQK